MSETSDAETAKALIACLDLTDLGDDCTEADVAALCRQAATPHGNVAAICIWPRFLPFARDRLAQGIRIATVVNFPHGTDRPDKTWNDTALLAVQGADEVDMVIDYTRLPREEGYVERQVRRVKEAAVALPLKAILETGELGAPHLIARAAEEALAGGADFLKTSTGKTRVSATLPAAAIMLGVIAERGGTVGFKPSGGIRTFEEAKAYRDLAEAICGTGWATPERFRIGASSLLADLLSVAGGAPRGSGKGGY